MRVGLDVGSTTIKCVVLNENDDIVYSSYERHFSKIVEKTVELLEKLKNDVIKGEKCQLMISGSAGMGMAQCNQIGFTQEVFATKIACDRLNPDVDVVIELGGEDAKILFISNRLEVRMNGSCAGGTGAFIDQMATLLNCDASKLNEYATNATRSYTIASRCGVFAKTDIQPLLNQGAKKEDIALSIFYAIVNQTIAGLAQGRPISGNVLYLGGPLTFLSNLRKCFDKVLKLEGKCPDNSLYYVALGAAYNASDEVDLNETIDKLKNYSSNTSFAYIEPLFKDEDDYLSFKQRHDLDYIPSVDINNYKGNAYLGIDAGSTTLKCVLIDEDGNILLEDYRSNNGNPIVLIKDFLINLYTRYPDVKIIGSGCTGYGEDITKNAFNIDEGIVETIAHLTSAKHFKKDVDFIIDIGGQDMKCFKIRNGIIDNIFLNEACSSGCGSFLQTFATNLGYDIADFAKLALFADKPVDLGSRCTVFMNSSVKQAQKDGASIENISAGLAISVVKNALYKVIRCASVEDLGKNIVVQGGTFYNDAVLRAFEKELNVNVIRPNIAGLMGAYGVALYVKNKNYQSSSILTLDKLLSFEHKVNNINCGLCENHCQLTVNTFNDNRKFISGNRCERPITKKVKTKLNMYDVKREKLKQFTDLKGTKDITVGLPMGLNMYELLPFWSVFFNTLGFNVVTSSYSNRMTYLKGQNSIPSDTVCFPAKLMHGHIEELIAKNVDVIFYPCMSYNIDEHNTDNHYNCPVVAYYPEVIKANILNLNKVDFIYDY
ncbi:MAG: acyl-CoA dehydratase activase, partial [Erysipelotrichaceae bacterium]|nr:acyl-CoA dehydratase activase [Erysipelotrichaceae bacterium]